MSTLELIKAMGTGLSGVGVEIGRRFREASPKEREEIIISLRDILETHESSKKRLYAVGQLIPVHVHRITAHEKELIVDALFFAIENDNSRLVVHGALEGIPKLDSSQRAFESVQSVLDRDVSGELGVTTTTFITLGKMGEISVPFLIDSIADYPEEAIAGLAYTNNDRALDHLILLSSDEDPYLRGRAVHALGQFRYHNVVTPENDAMIKKILMKALNDEDNGVRRNAHEAMET